ncbi:hypothetical protein chiPu_0000532 [Chiloscyllium punctatum]|uniref:Uncharacterized protein n=1 Tax=Chiloscyllium punctatum TaxID=137246 RepID=A0A401RVG3_CHIPU|nr:hypothetical protein [Chiloscyllium punctatum]
MSQIQPDDRIDGITDVEREPANSEDQDQGRDDLQEAFFLLFFLLDILEVPVDCVANGEVEAGHQKERQQKAHGAGEQAEPPPTQKCSVASFATKV